MPSRLIDDIRRFVALQMRLIEEFRQKFPHVSDWSLLLDVPKSGSINLDREVWRFQRHGGGLAFKSENGIVVDVHREAVMSDAIDAWRISLYIKSQNQPNEHSTEEHAIEEVLKELKERGELEETAIRGIYRLVT